MLQTDSVLEYIKNDVSIFCLKNKTVHQTSYSHTSQQNGIAERKHMHILDVAGTIMFHMYVLKYLVFDAVLSACHLINRMPSSVLSEKISFSCLHPHKSIFSMTPQVFSCTCFVQNLSLVLDKLSPTSIKYVFVGYFQTQKGH